MGRKPGKKLSFMRILMQNDFTRLLRLPPLFMQKYGPNIPRKATLRIESGRTWDVKLEATKDGLFCFSKGWNAFSQCVDLKFGQLVIFRMSDINGGGLYFDVSVYETNGCKKEFSTTEDVVHNMNFKTHRTREKAVTKSSSSWEESSPFYFEIVLKPHHKSRITPVRTFARAAGLMEKERVEVIGEHRNVWVTLDHGQKDVLRVDMSRGWGEFRTANRLVFGKTYSFEFKPRKNVIKVKEVKH